MLRLVSKLAAILGLCCLLVGIDPAAGADQAWVDAWSAAPDAAGPPLQARTVRQMVRLSVGGTALRLRLSNLFGNGPITIGPVHVALHGTGSAIQPGSDHPVSFAGQNVVTIAAGDSTISEPVEMNVAALQELAVSLYLPGSGGPSTIHASAVATAYLTIAYDATAAVELPPGQTRGSRFFLTDVEVAGDAPPRAIVAFGDSITDGVLSTRDANRRWPDLLAERLQADPALATIAVVNAGISGNRVLNPGAGQSALARFERDALSKPGVRWIVLLEGINDIGAATMPRTPNDFVTAGQIIDGLKILADRAHRKGIKIWGATLTPFGGVPYPYNSEAGEARRQAVNTWIRSGGAFDAVIDFDLATRDPDHPDRLLPAYDSGDHLHPNDAGDKAMAAAIDLDLLRQDK